jgi:hypothetical protein
MEIVIVICGALGGWLLVAGPIYQAALELREQEVDREAIAAAASSIAPPRKLSPWWWLLPPVAYILHQRQSRAHGIAVMDALRPEQREQTISFLNKANGWLIVALGAFLIAFKETWELRELLDWPVVVFWVLVVVLMILCVANATFRMLRTARLLQQDESAAAAHAAPAPE